MRRITAINHHDAKLTAREAEAIAQAHFRRIEQPTSDPKPWDRMKRAAINAASYIPDTGEEDTEGEVLVAIDLDMDVPPAPDCLLYTQSVNKKDRKGIFPIGKVNWLSSDPGLGKSWMMLLASVKAARRGMWVMWIDGDDELITMVSRVRSLRGAKKALKGSLLRVDEAAVATPKDVRRLIGSHPEGKDGWANTLVCIDTANSTGSPQDGSAINDWYDRAVKPLWKKGATVIVADHLAKNPDTRKAGAAGSMAKIANVTGTAVMLEGIGFSPGNDGKLEVVLTKDRAGTARTAGKGIIGYLTATTHPKGKLDLVFAPGFKVSVTDPAGGMNPIIARAQELLQTFVAKVPEGEWRATAWCKSEMHGATNDKPKCLEWLSTDTQGYLEQRKRGKGFEYRMTDKGRSYIKEGMAE